MAEERVNRRLAAIAVADVVGFSRLMEADEAGTLAALRERRKAILDPVVKSHGGRIVKVMGDGVLIEFDSAVEAVRGMLELQRGMEDANAGLPQALAIRLRVGVNLGDVVRDGKDIYGDGVNVAARLEQIAEPGGICISGKVHEEIRGKVEARFEDAGDRQLKNVTRPVRVFRFAPARAGAAVGPAGETPDRPAIAVLPLANLSGEAGQQFLCDGITEDITTELSRFRQLRVVSRNSAARFRGTDVDMIRAGRELGVAYLLEGSVRRMGPRIRITAQLIDAATGNHVWADRYDCPQDDIFEVQDRVVQTVAGTVCGRVSAAGLELARRKPPASLAAYDHVLRGDALPWTTPENEAEVRKWFRKAIEADPGYARAFALLSFALNRQWLVDMSGSDALREEAFDLAVKAVSLDENDTLCQLAMVWAHVHRGAAQMAEPYLARALALNPNQPSTQTDLAIFQNCTGEPGKAIVTFLEARRIDPFFAPSWYWGELGAAYYNARRHEEAIASMQRSATLSTWYRIWLAASYGQAGRLDEARECAGELRRRLPDFSGSRFLSKKFLVRAEDIEHLAEGLRKAGLHG